MEKMFERVNSSTVSIGEIFQEIIDDDDETLLMNLFDLIETKLFDEMILPKFLVDYLTFVRQFVYRMENFVIDQLNEKLRKNLFFRLFDRLNSSKRIDEFLNDDEHFSAIFIVCLRLLIRLNVKLNEFDLEKYRENLLKPMINRCDELDHRSTLTDEILRFISHLTIQTKTIRTFLRLDYPTKSLRFLFNKDSTTILLSIYRICQHDDGVEAFNSIEIVELNELVRHLDTLGKFYNEMVKKKVEFILDSTLYRQTIEYVFLIALISAENYQSLSESTKTFLDHYFIRKSLENLHIWVKLCRWDEILFYHLIPHRKGKERFFSDLLENFLLELETRREQFDEDIRTIVFFVNIYWSLSFHTAFRSIVTEDLILLRKLLDYRSFELIDRVTSNLYFSQQIGSIRRAFDGIEENLSPTPSIVLPSTIRCSLMISYSHVDMKICRQIVELLTPLTQLSIYVDIHLCKYTWKDICQMINRADLVLILLSKNYSKSNSCRQEFQYASERTRRSIVSLRIDEDFRSTNWLKSRILNEKSFRYDPNDWNEFLSMINEYFPRRNSFDVHQWTGEQVKQWFEKNQIRNEIETFYRFGNGHELVLFAQAISRSPWTNEFERIRQRFETSSDFSAHHFLKFVNALEKLI